MDVAATSVAERKRLDWFRKTVHAYLVHDGVGAHIIRELSQSLSNDSVFGRMHLLSLKLMAAECSAFLEGVDTSYETWRPYKRWARLLTEQDTILTFNYDRVLDLLATEDSAIRIPTPAEMKAGIQRPGRALALKLHGSIDWFDESAGERESRIVRAEGLERFAEGDKWRVAALHCEKRRQLALATPGPAKQRSVEKFAGLVAFEEEREAGLNWLWQSAQGAIEQADAIVILGYSLPPTDAYTRGWLLEHIATAAQRKGETNARLRLHIVLGPNASDPAVARLAGLFGDIPGTQVHRRTLWAEDFLASVTRHDILWRAVRHPNFFV